MKTKAIHNKGANIVVSSYAEVLFTPSGDIARWKRGLTNHVKRSTAAAAPTNKRPRWSHYGKPLKQTFISSTNVETKSMQINSYVGSTALHARYVDQGTGVHGPTGRPYEAKILPPWRRGEPSLYEYSWKAGSYRDKKGNRVGAKPIGTVTVKGQRGQHFFEKGLRDGFKKSRLDTVNSFGDPLHRTLRNQPFERSSIADFNGSTTSANHPGFVEQLNEWRSWRREAWYSKRWEREYRLDRKPYLGRNGGRRTRFGQLHQDRTRRRREQARQGKKTLQWLIDSMAEQRAEARREQARERKRRQRAREKEAREQERARKNEAINRYNEKVKRENYETRIRLQAAVRRDPKYRNFSPRVVEFEGYFTVKYKRGGVYRYDKLVLVKAKKTPV